MEEFMFLGLRMLKGVSDVDFVRLFGVKMETVYGDVIRRLTAIVVIGIIYGAISGYFGGKVDMIMMRIVDIIYSLPDMLIVILLSVVLQGHDRHDPRTALIMKLGTNMISIFIVFGLLYWVGMARLVRGQVLSIKEQRIRAGGSGHAARSAARIIRKHMLPNCISVIIISAALQVPSAPSSPRASCQLCRSGRHGAHALPGFAGLRDARSGTADRIPTSCCSRLWSICLIVLALQPVGRRSARRLRPQADARKGGRCKWHCWKSETCTPPSSADAGEVQRRQRRFL